MRIGWPVLGGLALGCTAPPPVPPPLPAPEPASAPAAPSRQPRPPLASGAIDGHVDYCVVRNGRLESVELEYLPSSGDSVYQGVPISRAFPTDSRYALNAGWYVTSDPISFGDVRYVKYGLPRILGTTDVVPVGMFHDVPVFAEPTANRERPEVIYLPTRPGCEFQPYIGGGIK